MNVNLFLKIELTDNQEPIVFRMLADILRAHQLEYQ